MRVSEIFAHLNTFEKNHLLRIIEGIVSEKPKNIKVVDKILNQIDGQIKNADNLSVEQIFNLVRDEYKMHILNEFSRATSQLDIITDIIIRDGNSLMKREWLLKLYEKEVRELKKKSKSLISQIQSDESNERYRDYRIYQKCLKVAYENDLIENRDSKVTQDEQSILNTLVSELDLSHEEVKLINLDVIPFQKMDIDEMITYLVKSGIVLYSKKHHQIYVPDEIIAILRQIRGKEVSDKVFDGGHIVPMHLMGFVVDWINEKGNRKYERGLLELASIGVPNTVKSHLYFPCFDYIGVTKARQTTTL